MSLGDGEIRRFLGCDPKQKPEGLDLSWQDIMECNNGRPTLGGIAVKRGGYLI